MTHAETTLTDKQKAAIIVIALGAERAAKTYRHLSENEVEKLTVEVASFQGADDEKIKNTLQKFNDLCIASKYVAEGGVEYARNILDKVYGTKTAVQLIGKITQSIHEQSFSFLKKVDHKHLLSYIQNEHPQTIALVLLYTTPEQAAAILCELPREKQIDVMIRIATMDRTSPQVIKQIESILGQKLSMVSSTSLTEVGGVKPVADILNCVDRSTEKFILDELDKANHQLTDSIRSRMFVFEDIVYLDSKSIQRVLRDINSKDLAIALKGANAEVKQFILANMTHRMQEAINEDIEFLGPIRLSEVEEAQQKIVQIIRKLEDSNEIVVSRGGKDDILV